MKAEEEEKNEKPKEKDKPKAEDSPQVEDKPEAANNSKVDSNNDNPPKKTTSRRGRKKAKKDGVPKEWAVRQKYSEFWAHMVSIKAPQLVIKQVGKAPQVSPSLLCRIHVRTCDAGR